MPNEIDVDAANRELAGKSPQEIIHWAVGVGGRCIVSTNFNPWEPAILQMIHEIEPDMPVLWVDIAFNRPATYRVAEKLIDQLKLNIHRFIPRRSAAHIEAVFGGVPAMEDKAAHDAFTEEVKIEPFKRGLSELAPDVWLTAVRRDQTDHRQAMSVVSRSPGLPLKVCPLLDWSLEETEAYIQEKGLPLEYDYHDPTKVLDKRECGLHKADLTRD